jgi:hypothetical protein
LNNTLYAKNTVNNNTDHIISVNEITSYLVHDINNILQTIVGNAEILIMTNQKNNLAYTKACAIKTSIEDLLLPSQGSFYVLTPKLADRFGA